MSYALPLMFVVFHVEQLCKSKPSTNHRIVFALKAEVSKMKEVNEALSLPIPYKLLMKQRTAQKIAATGDEMKLSCQWC